MPTSFAGVPLRCQTLQECRSGCLVDRLVMGVLQAEQAGTVLDVPLTPPHYHQATTSALGSVVFFVLARAMAIRLSCALTIPFTVGCHDTAWRATKSSAGWSWVVVRLDLLSRRRSSGRSVSRCRDTVAQLMLPMSLPGSRSRRKMDRRKSAAPGAPQA